MEVAVGAMSVVIALVALVVSCVVARRQTALTRVQPAIRAHLASIE
jgi:hypothetical protein